MFLFLRGDRSAETWQIFQELDWTLGWWEASSVREREREREENCIMYFLSLSVSQYSMKVLELWELYVVVSLLGRWEQFPSGAGSQSQCWLPGSLVLLAGSLGATVSISSLYLTVSSAPAAASAAAKEFPACRAKHHQNPPTGWTDGLTELDIGWKLILYSVVAQLIMLIWKYFISNPPSALLPPRLGDVRTGVVGRQDQHVLFRGDRRGPSRWECSLVWSVQIRTS